MNSTNRKLRVLMPIGAKYNMLTIVQDMGIIDGIRHVKAHCECGEYITRGFYNIKRGGVKSCGCYNRSLITTHNLSNHPLYKVWEGMIQRCYNEKSPSYKHYGGRGVKMCEVWRSDFNEFYKWAITNGWEKGLYVDKDIKAPIDKVTMYCPEYCSLVSQKTNTRNRRGNRILEYNGIKKCVAEWADFLKMPYEVLTSRIKRGWGVERAFNEIVIARK